MLKPQHVFLDSRQIWWFSKWPGSTCFRAPDWAEVREIQEAVPSFIPFVSLYIVFYVLFLWMCNLGRTFWFHYSLNACSHFRNLHQTDKYSVHIVNVVNDGCSWTYRPSHAMPLSASHNIIYEPVLFAPLSDFVTKIWHLSIPVEYLATHFDWMFVCLSCLCKTNTATVKFCHVVQPDCPIILVILLTDCLLRPLPS